MADYLAFVSAVALYQTTGGELAMVLDRLASGARDRNQFRRQFFASTARGRVTAIIIGAAVPLLLLVYAMQEPERSQGPQGVRYRQDPLSKAHRVRCVGGRTTRDPGNAVRKTKPDGPFEADQPGVGETLGNGRHYIQPSILVNILI